ncbi:3-methyl-2-oxobutanoate hydroxymethyltransferase [Alkalimarinus sediminis]|uniref:3-methyl-2-oxobutanoate hydroxymethyltransferase n=2 Tax=Alkalimarinus sediminis TaxID=1632866 RepID=A0A9E8HJ67_9ALTE|nr:3-methyl-2-oxobutanoate hydroxymethyltransferase [Alkalimarinus sediminis]UZW75354.1 3-methyl-2-oxobutanoate hydroxymethyltransferase [Alkalimarinus sediminis]
MPTTIQSLRACKEAGEKFTCLTGYDSTFSHLIGSAGVEVILVGDSLGMVLQGHDSTLPVTMEQMIYHTEAVKRGNQGALIMADMPFMSYATPEQALENAALLMQAGAHLVKIEGGDWLCDTISMLSERGIPVCAHLGLTPQSVNKLGGYKVQGREAAQAEEMIAHAVAQERAGADLILLECVPSELANKLTKSISAPVIGIGAGAGTDGQVLVMHDLLGITPGRRPKFVKDFMAESNSIEGAIKAYVEAVKTGQFPGSEHSFS